MDRAIDAAVAEGLEPLQFALGVRFLDAMERESELRVGREHRGLRILLSSGINVLVCKTGRTRAATRVNRPIPAPI